METFIVGVLLAVILFFAGKKAIKDMKSGKCASCTEDCSSRVDNNKVTNFTDIK